MTAAELLSELGRLGIHVEAHGDKLRYHPQAAVTAELLDRLRQHKAELLALLRPATLATIDADPADDDANWLERIEADGSRTWTRVDVAELEIIDLAPCPRCGGIDQWQSLTGDLFGRTPGRWRCAKCEPPTAARRIRERAERLRGQRNHRNHTRRNE